MQRIKDKTERENFRTLQGLRSEVRNQWPEATSIIMGRVIFKNNNTKKTPLIRACPELVEGGD